MPIPFAVLLSNCCFSNGSFFFHFMGSGIQEYFHDEVLFLVLVVRCQHIFCLFCYYAVSFFILILSFNAQRSSSMKSLDEVPMAW